MAVVVFGEIRVAPEDIGPLSQHLRTFVETTLREDGCLAFHVAEDLFDRGLVRFSEIWPDEATLARHGQAPHMAPWRAAGASLGVRDRKFIVYDASDPRPL